MAISLSARSRVLAAVLLLEAIGSPAAAADGDPGRGKAVVEQWCRACHLRPGEHAKADMAPAYEDIVQLPGRDRAYFETFLREDHFPMTTFRLFDHEKADVVAYLMALQKAAGN